jgi:beta-galactosidase
MTTTPATAAFHGCGAAYDPAFWAPTLWPEHVRLMRECGIRFVRLFEFSWSHFEARPGVYDFGWSDDFLALLDEAGIGFVLCTPGATPPRWLTHKHPETLVMHADGRRDRGEIRRHGCPNSPAFMRSTLDLTRLLAERYGRRPGLVGWQIDNEFGHPVCYCPLCQADFRGWLQEEFGSLEEVNRRLGMVVWSRDYSHWDEVQIPVGACPQLHHAFRRYTSQLWQRYARLHVEALRPFTDRPISTNINKPIF